MARKQNINPNEIVVRLDKKDIDYLKSNISDKKQSMSSYVRALIDKDMGVSNGKETENFI